MNCEDISRATGSDYCYAYRELLHQATAEQVASYCEATRRGFVPIASAFASEANSLWILRHYLAIKFVAAASLLVGSSTYSADRNLLMGVPYFNYYALLNICRAYLMTSPQVIWDGVKTVKMSHGNILNQTANFMSALDPMRRTVWHKQFATLREHRELFSYRFPLSGPDLVEGEALDPERVASLARLIGELASLNTECFEAVLRTHTRQDFTMLPISDHTWASAYALAGQTVIDPLDRYRFGKFLTSWRTVSTLEVMTSDGLIDDLYGQWTAQEDRLDRFDPDQCSNLILAL